MTSESATSESETAAIGCADDSLLDPVDVVRGLAHMDVLRERVTHRRGHRLRDFPALAITSAQKHEAQFGHPLMMGCCRPYSERAA